MFDHLTLGWPRRRDSGRDDMATGVMSGIAAGTRVATGRGWQRIEEVAVGDQVLTFDNGLQVVRAITRTPLWEGTGLCPRQFRPLHVPAGVIGNREAMTLLPRQGIMIESDVAEELTGDPFALVRAESLEGVCGIERIEMTRPVEVFVLRFDEDEVVFTADGALCVCAADGDMISRLLTNTCGPDYRLLSDDTDAELIAEIRREVQTAHREAERLHKTALARVA